MNPDEGSFHFCTTKWMRGRKLNGSNTRSNCTTMETGCSMAKKARPSLVDLRVHRHSQAGAFFGLDNKSANYHCVVPGGIFESFSRFFQPQAATLDRNDSPE